MKILYYNWSPFYKNNNSGGGVNIYQNNLIDHFSDKKDFEIYFLSSGTYYSFFDKQIKIVAVNQSKNPKAKTFILKNSPVVAPASGLGDLNIYLQDEKTYKELKHFIQTYGPFDVFHLNNIEGLGINCFKIKNDFPSMKVIYSLHNYFMFCPNAYLFFGYETNCYMKNMQCEKCMHNTVSQRIVTLFYKIDDLCRRMHMDNLSPKIKQIGKSIYSHLHRKREFISNAEVHSDIYEAFRKENVMHLNMYVDKILAVSHRVREIALYYGIKEEKIETSYIGTKFASNTKTEQKIHTSKYLTIAYMGFLKKEKGIEFLCNSLEKLDKKHAAKVIFKCYARNTGTEYEIKLINKIQKLNNVINKSEYHNGYTHDELPSIMKEIDVGIVPVIWEDNFPQVAVEFASNGVAVLSSNLGGAHELSTSKNFVYEASSVDDFLEKITAIIDCPELINDYFAKMKPLTNMDVHIKKLTEYYLP